MFFSVIIPVHNKLPHIERAVCSVLQQTHRNFELILVDDGSTDGSYEKLSSFKDKRIRVFRRDHPGSGGYAARNLGIQNAIHEWITFLDADDKWNLTKLEKTADSIREHPNATIVTNGWFWMDGERIQKRDVFKIGFYKQGFYTPFALTDFLLNQDLMWTGAVTIKKEILEKAGLFPNCRNCKKGGDLDTWIRSLKISRCNVYIDEPLSYYYRDTVNRVTDHKHNPTSYFCAYPTLMEIRRETKDSKLRKAVEAFVNKNLFLIIIKRIQAEDSPNWWLFAKFHPRWDVLYYIPRTIWEYCKINFVKSNERK